jgi:peptidoglycan/LPS O-acetylase OafA/YrhL
MADAVTHPLRSAADDSANVRDRQLISIQVLRAFAAFAVVMGHIPLELARTGAQVSFNYGQVGVDVFFVISGFIMVYTSQALFGSRDGPATFARRRLERIVPLYWITTTGILVYMLATYRSLAAIDFSPGMIAGSYLFLPVLRPSGALMPVNGVGWTLVYEMYFYAVFAAFIAAPRTIALTCVGGILTGMVALGAAGMLPEFLIAYANPIVFEFAFGMALAVLYLQGVRLPIAVSLACVGLALTGFAAFADVVHEPAARPVYLGLPAALLVAGAVLTSKTAPSGPLVRALTLLGGASYALYLVHGAVQGLPRHMAPDLLAALPTGVAWAMIAVLNICVALAVHRCVERPIAAWFRGRARRRTAVADAAQAAWCNDAHHALK